MLRDLKRISLLIFIKGETVKNIVTIVRTKWARRRCILSTAVSLWGRRKVEVKSVEAGAIVMNRWAVVSVALFIVAATAAVSAIWLVGENNDLRVQLQTEGAQIAALHQNVTEQLAAIRGMETQIRDLRRLLVFVNVSYSEHTLRVNATEWNLNLTFFLVNTGGIPFTITQARCELVNLTFIDGTTQSLGKSSTTWVNATARPGAAFPSLMMPVTMDVLLEPKSLFVRLDVLIPEVGESLPITFKVEITTG